MAIVPSVFFTDWVFTATNNSWTLGTSESMSGQKGITLCMYQIHRVYLFDLLAVVDVVLCSVFHLN